MAYIGGENSPAGEGGGDFEEDTPAVEEVHSSEEEVDTAPVEAMGLGAARSVPAPSSTPVTVDPYLPPPGSSPGGSASSSSATGPAPALAAAAQAASVLAEFDEVFSQRAQTLKRLRDEIYILFQRKRSLEHEVRNLERRRRRRSN
jgi:hypothetical protein